MEHKRRDQAQADSSPRASNQRWREQRGKEEKRVAERASMLSSRVGTDSRGRTRKDNTMFNMENRAVFRVELMARFLQVFFQEPK